MFADVKAELMKRAALLIDGDLPALAGRYAYPLAAFLGASRVIVNTRDEMIAILELLRSELLRRKVYQILPDITAIDLPRGGRMRAWVRWHEVSTIREENRISKVTYYCTLTPAGIRTDMLQYTELSMPELHGALEALALSA
ncbi:MAG: hypothetical protein HC844_04540 [Tabrizicola sp.]|nr:hypothetical protein [Tabrizicola sp.]